MLKKKRFSGLFGTSVTEIPSPNPEQQSSPPLQPIRSSSGGVISSAALGGGGGGGGVGGGNHPRALLANQGRQMSLGNFGNLLAGATGGNSSSGGSHNGNSNSNGIGSNGTAAGDDSMLSRADIHNSLDSLKKLVVAAETYRELATSLAKSTKQLGKCFREYGETKGMDNTHVMCLMASATFYETFAEMQKKLASTLQKDFELLQTSWEKHSKRISKDEKAHDELLHDLDEKIKKISQGYDKKSKKPDPSTALVSHEKYITSLAELQESIAVANRDHRNNIARRERYTHSLTSQISCRMAEAQFLAVERQLRGSGPSVVKIKEWAPYAALEMPQPTLVSDGEPTIQIKNISYDEYTGEHTGSNSGSTTSRVDSGVASVASSNSTPSGTIVTHSEMPPITLPPFEPMVQQQQQHQLQQTSGPGLPTSMPDPRNYVTKPSSLQPPQPSIERQAVPPTTTGPLPTTMPVPMPAPVPASSATSGGQTTFMKDSAMHGRPTSSIVMNNVTNQKSFNKDNSDSSTESSHHSRMDGDTGGGAIKRIESKSTSSEISPQDSVSMVGINTPTKTPGAFPDSTTNTPSNPTTKVEPSPFSHSAGKGDGPSDKKVLDGGNKHSDSAFHRSEHQDSRSGPSSNQVNDKRDGHHGGSGGGGGGGGGGDNRQGNREDAHDDMGNMHRENGSRGYTGHFTTHTIDDDDDEEEMHHERTRRHAGMDRDDDDYADVLLTTRDVYGTAGSNSAPPRGIHDHPYSPPPFEIDNPYYEEDERDTYARLQAVSTRYFDEDESLPSAGIGTTNASGRGEYFPKSRYEPDRAYEYEGMASSAPASSYTREQYPTVRDTYPSRPTLEDRERDLERMNQQKMEGFKAGLAAAAAAAAAVTSTSVPMRPPMSNYNSSNNGTRRPEPVRAATGTVASLRRRFSDLSVSDMSSLPGPVSPTMGPRGNGGGGGGYGDDGRRDNRHPPRVSTPQSRAVMNGTSGPPPVSSQYRYGLNKGATSTGNLLNGAGHDRYSRGVEYDDNIHRTSGYVNDRQRRPMGAGGSKNY